MRYPHRETEPYMVAAARPPAVNVSSCRVASSEQLRPKASRRRLTGTTPPDRKSDAVARTPRQPRPNRMRECKRRLPE
jgi:hypothetical protein